MFVLFSKIDWLCFYIEKTFTFTTSACGVVVTTHDFQAGRGRLAVSDLVLKDLNN